MAKKYILLCGGLGTRLWPYSRENYPKQFLSLTGNKSLLINTISRIIDKDAEIIIIASNLHEHVIRGQLSENNFTQKIQLICEPYGRNTAPAILLACKLLSKEDVAVVMPTDHWVDNVESFNNDINNAAKHSLEKDVVVTVGISPTRAATAYGYLSAEELSIENIYTQTKFVEKPDESRAKELISSNALWNSGMFIFPIQLMLNKFREYMPQMFKEFSSLNNDLKNIGEVYSKIESESIDYGIMEKISDIHCLKASFGWSDLGSWSEVFSKNSELSKELSTTIDGNDNLALDYSNFKKRVFFLGLENIRLVSTPDATIVFNKDQDQLVKKVFVQLKESEDELVNTTLSESRPWGTFEILRNENHFKLKKITVLPLQKLSYQSHKFREENWTIIKGNAVVVLNGKEISLKAGEHIFIPLGAKHRIMNLDNSKVLEFIEVQTGTYFGEDDIVRYEDIYNRT